MSHITRPESALIRETTVSLPDHSQSRCDKQHYQESWLSAKFLSFFRQESLHLPTTNAQRPRLFQSATNTPQIAAQETWCSQREPPKSPPTRRRHNSRISSASNKGKKVRNSPAVDPREGRHERRKAILKEILEPMINPDDSTTSSILLCWGNSSNARIWPVKITNSDDETGIWQDISHAWYSHRGWWRKHIPLLNIKEVDIVEISIAGPDPRGVKNPILRNRYIGMFMKEDICAQKKKLEKTIDNYQEQECPCNYNLSTGEIDCSYTCESWLDWDKRCPEGDLYKAQRDLEHLNLRSDRLKFAFTQPYSAAPFDLLSREHVILSHLDILGQLDVWHCPELGELRFRGFMIHEGWEFNPQHIVLPLSVTVFFILVVAAKLIYGDWETAWTAGGSLVALATLLWMWTDHFIGR